MRTPLRCDRSQWWTLGAAALLPALLTTAWLVADAVQPASYSPVRQTVSVLSGYAGIDRWIVTAALYAIGLGYVVTAAGLAALATPARVGLVIAGAAAIGVASFPEPAHGTSHAHALFTVIGAVTITIWPALVARQESALAAVGVRATIMAICVSLALFGWTVVETRNGSALGLAERVSSALQSSWPFVVAFALRRPANR